ncbi:MAG TPA: hypothetical protein VN634_14790 [Candidatus Limnocylindrales bacterium]|nr:hypothetical protein [Candidatus Limnocylindrales bacterium]
MTGCRSGTPAPKNPLDDVWTPSEEDVYPAASEIRIEPIQDFGGHRYAHEVAGIVVALYETGLADLSGVVPHYDQHGPPPGIDRWLTGASKHWTAKFSFGYDRDALQIVLRLCPSSGPCKGASASGPRELPEGAITELLVWTAGQIHAPVPAGLVEAWSKPLSHDRYAVLVLGRAAASWYGMVDPVNPEERGIPGKDPLARVVLIDPSLSMAHYIMARRALDIGHQGVAVRAFERARENTPDRFVYQAASAAAFAAAGQWADARKSWDELDARWPDDSRFVIPRVETYLASGMAREAQGVIDELPDRFDHDPEIARLRVGIADKIGPGPDYEKLISEWETAAEYDPEPVRRHIALRLRDGRFEEAFELLPKLEARGASAEAKQMMIAIGAGIGRFDEAARQAALVGSDSLAQRLRIRAVLEKEPRSVPPALLNLGETDARLLAAKLLGQSNPTQALADVQAILREDRFLAEAIVLEVNLLERLGRTEEAIQARERLQFADPAFVSGPRVVAGATAKASGSSASGSQNGASSSSPPRPGEAGLPEGRAGGSGARTGGAGMTLPSTERGGGGAGATPLSIDFAGTRAGGAATAPPEDRAGGAGAPLSGARTAGGATSPNGTRAAGTEPPVSGARAAGGDAPLPGTRPLAGEAARASEARPVVGAGTPLSEARPVAGAAARASEARPAAGPAAALSGARPAAGADLSAPRAVAPVPAPAPAAPARAAAAPAVLPAAAPVAGKAPSASSGAGAGGGGGGGPRTVPGATSAGSQPHASSSE